MTSRDIFILALRIIGIWELTRAVDYFVEAFDVSTRLYRPSVTTIGASYTHLLVYLAVGLYLLSGAPQLVRRIYGDSLEGQRDDATPKA